MLKRYKKNFHFFAKKNTNIGSVTKLVSYTVPKNVKKIDINLSTVSKSKFKTVPKNLKNKQNVIFFCENRP